MLCIKREQYEREDTIVKRSEGNPLLSENGAENRSHPYTIEICIRNVTRDTH